MKNKTTTELLKFTKALLLRDAMQEYAAYEARVIKKLGKYLLEFKALTPDFSQVLITYFSGSETVEILISNCLGSTLKMFTLEELELLPITFGEDIHVTKETTEYIEALREVVEGRGGSASEVQVETTLSQDNEGHFTKILTSSTFIMPTDFGGAFDKVRLEEFPSGDLIMSLYKESKLYKTRLLSTNVEVDQEGDITTEIAGRNFYREDTTVGNVTMINYRTKK